MLHIEPREVLHLRGSGGERFTLFVDDVIRSQGYLSGVAQSEIKTNQRTNVRDGGVDTQVQQALANDKTGWFGIPTCWQYKATNYAGLTDNELRGEIRQPFASQLIKEGYGYRFCICDELPAQKVSEWESILNDEAMKISLNAQPCRVITAANLATWAQGFFGTVVKYFRPQFGQIVHLDALGTTVSDLTREYVPVANWEPIQARIRDHVNLSGPCADVILPITGDAGVGKTRMMYETLRTIEGLGLLVGYTSDDEVAQNLAISLANDSTLQGVLIADECSLEAREKLRRALNGHRARIRVIAIDNFAERPSGLAAEQKLDRIPNETVEVILTKNFPGVSPDRRRNYSDLSRGFLKIAALLASRDAELQTAGTLGPIEETLRGFLRAHLSDQQRSCLEVLSLVQRVGFRGDVAEELNELCALVGVNRESFMRSAIAIKDATGFVVQAGRYFYLTPAPLVEVAFADAWHRLAELDPDAFLRRIPANLMHTFQGRVATSGSLAVREAVGRFFFEWTRHIRPPDLAEQPSMERLVQLIETDPSTYLPLLRRIIEDSKPDELRAVHGEYGTHETGWGPRRTLVWAMERLAIFPEFYFDAEAILFALAVAESEPRIGNNATGIWKQLQRPVLSGTAVSFFDRLPLLDRRFGGRTSDSVPILLGGLAEAFDMYSAGRMVGPPVVAGRIVPNDWQPKTHGEYRRCFQETLALMQRLADTADQDFRHKILALGIQQISTILEGHFLEQAKSLFDPGRLPSDLLPHLLEAVETFQSRQGNEKLDHDFEKSLESWRQTLLPKDLHGRLVAAIGKNPWHHTNEEDDRAEQEELTALALDLLSDPEVFDRELGWLSTPDARSAAKLGIALAREDDNFICAAAVLTRAGESRTTGLARGYLLGTIKYYPDRLPEFNRLLDRLEEQAPLVAFDIALVDDEKTSVIERTIRTLRSGSLEPEAVRGLLMGGIWRRIPKASFRDLLSELLIAIRAGNQGASTAAVTITGYRLHDIRTGEAEDILDDQVTLDLVWELATRTTEDGGAESHSWQDIVRSLVNLDAARAFKIACRGLISDDYHQRHLTEPLLVEFTSQHPHELMEALGEVMLDPERGWHFSIDKFDDVVAAIPDHAVRSWLEEVGVEGARRIARHLPPPHTDENGQAVVPPLTEFVLERFEDDDRTFREFSAGIHSREVMSGDIAAKYEEYANVADKFRNHPIRRVREWAVDEARICRLEARHWRQREEEMDIM